MKNFHRPPLVMSGLVLGLLALGNLLVAYFPYLRPILAALAISLYLLLIISCLRFPRQQLPQLRQPLVASVFPTFFMAGMLLASYLQGWQLPVLAQPLWWLSFMGNVLLILYFTWRFVLPFSWDHVFPSWSVLYVGIAMAGLTAPVTGQESLGQLIFWVGLVLTVLVLPLMAYKTYVIKLADPIQSNISTFCAPLSLLLATYLTTFDKPQAGLVLALLISSQALYLFVLGQLLHLANRPFNPGFSAFTFPFVISATSFKLASQFLGLTSPVWQVAVNLEIFLAMILLVFVSHGYLKHLLAPAE